jgi:hypothetical protein
MAYTVTSLSVSMAETFTRIVSHTTTITRTTTPYSPSHTNDISPKEHIIIDISVQAPLTCENYWTYLPETSIRPSANPDIAGVGVRMSVSHRCRYDANKAADLVSFSYHSLRCCASSSHSLYRWLLA